MSPSKAVAYVRPFAFVFSCVLIVFASTMAVQAEPGGRGRGRGGSPTDGQGGGPPGWAKSDKQSIPVPEPSTLGLLAVGAGAMIVKAMRERSKRNR